MSIFDRAAGREKRPRADAKVGAFRAGPVAHFARGLAGRAVVRLVREQVTRGINARHNGPSAGYEGELDESPG